MAITLPTAVVKKTRISPKISLFYGLPKVGKTGKMAELEGNLILDGEEGAEVYDCLRVTIRSTADIDEVYKQIMAQALAFKKANPDKPAQYLIQSESVADNLPGPWAALPLRYVKNEGRSVPVLS